MVKQLGLPYMGSKRKLASRIMDEILNANPKAKYFYDLFGGGGAVSFEALQRRRILEVYYNEVNAGVVSLLRKIQSDGVGDEFYQWISRETFYAHNKDDDWFGGLCKVVWSFGNNQRDYMFGKDIEEGKRLIHEICVNSCEKSLAVLNKKISTDVKLPIHKEGVVARRKRVAREIKYTAKNKKIIESVGQFGDKGARNIAQQLTQIEKLANISRLPALSQLNISNLSYDEVPIATPPEETIIYLDPPYENTKEYEKDKFDHRALERWILESPYKIYVSSYTFSLPIVATFSHKSSLSATANNEVTENLYCNREHKDATRLF